MTLTAPERIDTERTAAPHTDPAAPTAPAAKKQAVFRRPRIEDGPAVWELVENTPGLDSNSPYYYTLWFRDFADCSLVATVDDEIVGFLTGYRRPDEPDTYFAWQTAVTPRHGIPFLGVKIFEQVVVEQVAKGARFVEATVSAENKAIIMVLKKIAKKYAAEVETSVLFPSNLLPSAADGPDDAHHDEVLYRIGPLSAD
ncbi:diaminobutyrate acetyltransferase [Streptomyces sp. NPDC000151]|uniref:diaminobutyrate acetyltransferase n=1 Tax=Streptomyces sp. NPDC000151 TaxID=3154244 RepID=UPI0033189F71